MNLYTMGFSQKSAKEFFHILKSNNVSRLIDIRLNNKSQLAGFTKGRDLEYFLKAIINTEYMHIPLLAPTKELLDNYKKDKIEWDEYEVQFNKILKERQVEEQVRESILEDACLLCSEVKADKCHRRLVAEYLKEKYSSINIIHL